MILINMLNLRGGHTEEPHGKRFECSDLQTWQLPCPDGPHKGGMMEQFPYQGVPHWPWEPKTLVRTRD